MNCILSYHTPYYTGEWVVDVMVLIMISTHARIVVYFVLARRGSVWEFGM